MRKTDDLFLIDFDKNPIKTTLQAMGYTKALKEKFEKLDEEGAPDWQLKQLFKMAFAFATRTELGKEAMFPVMEKRGLAHREEGKIVCDY